MSKTHEGLCPEEYDNVRFIKHEQTKDYSNGDPYRQYPGEEGRVIPFESNDEWNRLVMDEKYEKEE